MPRWTIPGGRLFGIPIRLHLLLLLFFLGELIQAFRVFGWDALWIGPIEWLLIYVFILMHELGHCFAGRHMHGEADEILLWPLGGLAMISGVPRRAGPQVWVNIAGPLVNLAWCVVLGAVMLAGGLGREIVAAMPLFGNMTIPWPETHGVIWFFVCYAFGANLLNMLFNLIPAYPLDGGKVLVWSLSPRLGYHRAAMLGTTVGYAFALVLFFTGLVLGSVMLALLAIFVWVFCRWERAALQAGHAGVDDDVFGYDFTGGYTTLDASGPQASRRPRKARRPWFWQRWRAARATRERERSMSEELAVRARVDALLEKISTGGMGALSEGEREFLKDASRRYGP